MNNLLSLQHLARNLRDSKNVNHFAYPPKPVAILVLIGAVDLITTLTLYLAGLVQELNPLMRTLLHMSPALFTACKSATLALGYIVLTWYARKDWNFVQRVATAGSIAYVGIWVVWFAWGSAS